MFFNVVVRPSCAFGDHGGFRRLRKMKTVGSRVRGMSSVSDMVTFKNR